ncbi:putative endosialin isoform 2 [Scophthalmus maximus]|uniref:Putative endosialin isoform 2 n=1 Tax=Scophthalmus maximus TaxID=52904 RepID=A0A2U9B7Z4_SCOMX|nr:putative endosialin isoform 2 [Scophthalmus maximus]
MGVRAEGFAPAVTLPLLLTMVAYLGPLVQSAMDAPGGFTAELQSALDVQSWRSCVGDAVWLRNQVVAPLTEELVFRGAMLPMLVPCAGPTGAIFTAPLFFGVGHLHHIIEQRRLHKDSMRVILLVAGHVAGPVLCHSFCNSQGLPDFSSALQHPQRSALLFSYLMGALMFLVLLFPLTDPFLYGDQDGQFTNWLREDSPGTCAAPRCVAMTVHTSESGRESSDNFGWLDGSCALPLDGYVCQYNYKGMCPPLEDEGRGPAVYTTPFHLVSTLLTHVPYGSVASLPCPADSSDPDTNAEQTVLCMERDDETVGWSRDAPLCSSSADPKNQDWCSGDHGCEQYCQNTDTDYYCYCAEGFTIDEDGYSCKPDPLSQTDPPQLSSDSAGPADQPHVKDVCVEMGCEYDCVETQRGIRCTCPPGYQMGPDGRRCSDVDECQQQPCPQLCVNIPGTFHCTCHSGYQPDDDGECVDVDECLDEGSCEGTCENTVGSFTCLCNPGYELGSGGECVDVDECVGESPCQQQCLNYMGGYQCYCDNGYDLQTDGLTCQPSPDDEEYSTLTPDPSDSAHIPDMDPDHDIPWSTSFTPDPNFEADTNFDVDWLTEAPEALSPDMAHGRDNHLNQWDAQSPKRYQTAPPPTQKYNTGNEIDNDAKTGGRGASGGVGAETANGSATGTGEGSNKDRLEDFNDAADVGDGSAAGKRKHDKSWLLVALLVPLCVFLVVMLALGIVYCTSCAVDKSLSLSNCYRWMLPATPPDRRDGKTQA